MLLDPVEILPDYELMCIKLAAALSDDKNIQQDLVQEAYIAMWKAIKTFDETRGYLPHWLKMKAKGRMLTVLERQTWTGSDQRPAPGHQGFYDASSVDFSSPDDLNALESLLEGTGALDYVAYKYHEGEILRAINCLGPIQKDYVIRRFWYGQSNAAMKAEGISYQPEGAWKKSKEVLLEKLAHLVEV